MKLLWVLLMVALSGYTHAISCYKCTGSRSNNNTCVDKHREKVTLDGPFMCRVFERNGVVVSQKLVSPNVCTKYRKILPGKLQMGR